MVPLLFYKDMVPLSTSIFEMLECFEVRLEFLTMCPDLNPNSIQLSRTDEVTLTEYVLDSALEGQS